MCVRGLVPLGRGSSDWLIYMYLHVVHVSCVLKQLKQLVKHNSWNVKSYMSAHVFIELIKWVVEKI